MVEDRDWFLALKTLVNEETRTATMSPTDVDALVADIVSGRIAAPPLSSVRGRPRKQWVIGCVAVSVLAGGATAAALRHSGAEHPHEGIACHASTDLAKANAVVIPAAADPGAACAELWLTGVLPNVDQASGVVPQPPTMFICVGEGGGLDVFPQLSDPAVACADLGLVDAIQPADAEPLVVLQQRLTDEINLVCVNLDTARQIVETALTDQELDGWTVAVRQDLGECVKAGVDAVTKSVYLFSNPS